MKDLSEIMFMKVTEPTPLKNDVRHVISDNPNYHPYEGELTETSPQNTQLSRVWGIAAELAFEACFYEWVKTEDLQLSRVPLDKGFDYALLNLKTGKFLKIQVKRFNNTGKKTATNHVKLERTRTSPLAGTVVNNKYTMESFDYLLVFDATDTWKKKGRQTPFTLVSNKECFYQPGEKIPKAQKKKKLNKKTGKMEVVKDENGNDVYNPQKVVGNCKSGLSLYPTRRSKGLTPLDWEVLRQ